MAQFFVSMRRRRDPTEVEAFPWCVPALRNLTQLELRAPITFLAGENGSGKSTLLEAMAIGLNAVAVGSTDLSKDVSLATSLEFAKHYQFQRNGMPKARMFFRAEDVFGFCKRVITELEEFHKLKEEFRESLAEGSRGQIEAMALAEKQRAMLAARYGADPHAKSHGETFLHLLKTRVVPGGLYFLDEPETPLSPLRVLALLVLIHDGVKSESQFVIATHSPILLALPGAQILRLDETELSEVNYQELNGVRLMREFLNDPERYLTNLLRSS